MPTMREVIDAWDEAEPFRIHPTREHESEAAYLRSGRDQAQALAQVLTPGCDVVDFGCGDGRITVPLRRLGFAVTGADSSQRMLGRLRLADPDVPVVCSAGPDLREQLGRQVDAVVCLAVLIHHDYASQLQIIAGLRAAVKPGGRLVLDWPVSADPRERRDWIDVTTLLESARTAAASRLGLRLLEQFPAVPPTLPLSVWEAQ